MLRSRSQFIGALLAALGLFAWSIVQADPPTAQVVDAKGKVEVQRGGQAFEPLAAGATVAEGDRVHTGWKATATIGFPDGSVVEIQPMSLIAIEKVNFTGGTSRSRVLLRSGEVKAQIHKMVGAAGDFQVKTPTTTASVRGTHIQRISYDPGAGTQIRMGDEGLLAVLTRVGRSYLPANENTGVRVPGDQPFTPGQWRWIALSTDVSPAGSTGDERTGVRELGVPKTRVDGGSLAASDFGHRPDAFTVQPPPQTAEPVPTPQPVIVPPAPPVTIITPPTTKPGTPPSPPPGTGIINVNSPGARGG